MEKTSLLEKRFLTAICALTLFASGYSGHLIDSLMKQFKSHFNATTTDITYAIMIAAFSSSLGSPFSGDICTPHFSGLYQYYIYHGIVGFCGSGLFSLLNILVLESWGENSNPYLQTIHLMYACGVTTAPLVSANFVPKTENVLNLNGTEVKRESTAHEVKNALLYPYTISGLMMLAVAVFATIFELLRPYQRPVRGGRKGEHKQKASKKEKRQNLIFVVLCGVLLGFVFNVEIVTGKYIVMFLTSIPLGIEEKEAVYMNLLMSSFQTGMRVISIFLSIKLKPRVMIFISFSGILVSNCIIFNYYATSELGVKVGLAILGGSMSPLVPTFHSFVEQNVDETDKIGAFFILITKIPIIGTPYLLSHTIEKYPLTLIYSNILSAIMLLLIFGTLVILAKRWFSSKPDKCSENQNNKEVASAPPETRSSEENVEMEDISQNKIM